MMQTTKEIKLSDILDEIARGSNLDHALQLIAQKATADLKAQACKIWVVKHGDICDRCPLVDICTNRQMCLHLAAASGAVLDREYPRIPLSVLNTSLIVRGGVSRFQDHHAADDKLFGIQKRAFTTGMPSYGLYPLKGISGTVGLIGVFNDRLIDTDEIQILAQLSPAAVAAIRIAELQARHDSLRNQLEKSNEDVQRLTAEREILRLPEAPLATPATDPFDVALLKAELALRIEEISNLTAARQRLESQLSVAEQEKSGLEEAKSQLEAAVEQFEAILARIDSTMTDLRNRTELSERLCEEMEQRNRVLGEQNRRLAMQERAEAHLIANLSHELRTPMNSISGFTSLLLDDEALPLSDRQRHNLERIAQNARDMTEFLNQVLNYSKIEAGRMDVYAESVQLGDVVTRVVGVAEGLKAGRPITICTEIEDDLPTMHTDRIKLQQILSNLLSNAVKFTDEGVVTVAAERAGEDQISIRVRDTGIGIAEDDLPTIFDEFRQAGGRGPSARPGVGLGLAITRRLVVLLGGEIAVSSKLGEGSTFVVTLPQAIESREAPLVEREATALDPARTALVIGNDAAMLYLTRKYLTEAGYSVATSEDIGRGIDIVRMATPSVIILDLEATETIANDVNQLASHKQGGRFIACSANAGLERRAINAGADIFLPKPIDRDLLTTALAATLPEKSPPYVLVVDDNSDALEIVKEMISSLGYEVRTSTNGREALAEVARSRPAALILDLMLPEMDGFEVTHRLRLNPVWRDIPVILLTARDLSNEERGALRNSTTRLLQKGSFNREELLAELRSVIAFS